MQQEIIGTLGNKDGFLTCSMDVARKWRRYKSIKPYPEFEEAISDLKQGVISYVLVPGAYPKISNFIMDESIEVSETFTQKIPDLVLVSLTSNNNAASRKDINNLYFHPATTHLTEKVEECFAVHKKVNVSSNIESCLSLMNDSSENNCAITNSICANHYGLYVFSTLREGLEMPWVVFKSKIEVECQIV